jgi:hypothetical protein
VLVKISKKEAVYVHAGDGNYHCAQCKEWNPAKLCRLFSITDVVRDIGGCIYWAEGQPSNQNVPQKLVTPAAAKYEENKAGFGCKRCEYFLREGWACKEVSNSGQPDNGFIHPEGCCNLWDKDELFGNMI